MKSKMVQSKPNGNTATYHEGGGNILWNNMLLLCYKKMSISLLPRLVASCHLSWILLPDNIIDTGWKRSCVVPT